ncbi:phytoene/squalene synthase family protein [Bremerella sp. P1]|uniref:phytoene/squalene synthase family protein n=1 Tax=Bremerella sp. P1 TaxID=3026424 RepID=UPI00236817CD|nr:phytoene/squalene synthase family protein [Bremerella sp. P1]WDI43505.1 phytoene/squalene synthase family protein [Bremerella sp. P1]
MTDNLSASYDQCRHFSKQSGSNFLLSFWFLPREKRQAMYALYAFFRHTDDLADEDGADQAAQLKSWRDQFRSAMQGDFADSRLPALVDTIRRYEIPEKYFLESIEGVESDLSRTRFTDFDELHHYCYQVASAIGLSCLPVWGVRPNFDREAAIAAGVAFQLTNILRDIHEDALRGRIYVPLDDLNRFDVPEESLLNGQLSPGFEPLMRFEIERAEKLFTKAKDLRNDLHPDGCRIFDAMMETYHDLLKQIARSPEDVLRRKIQVGSWRKVKLFARLVMSRMPLGTRGPQKAEVP